MKRNATRAVQIGPLTLGSGHSIAVQSMTATQTKDIPATLRQVEILAEAGADLIRIAVDTRRDVEALAQIHKTIRRRIRTPFSVDLQENWPIAREVAPYVDKIRYNPGHLYHIDRERPIRDKVADLVKIAREHDCALRVGVNCGSVDPDFTRRTPDDDTEAMVASALFHSELLDALKFTNYVVSLKDSDPNKVIEANRRFAKARPDIPLHLGVTEAGLLPDGAIKTRFAFEQLIPQGIGDTIRVSLTVPFDDKGIEIKVGREILEDIAAGRFRSVPEFDKKGLNIISCPSCSRVENNKFVELAMAVKEATRFASPYNITIAIMGCRVNGPGETDDADLGLWCAPTVVNLKRKDVLVGTLPYDEVLPRLMVELDQIIKTRKT